MQATKIMLTFRQKQFADYLADGYNQTDAYRKAYDTVLMSSKTVWEAASRLSKNHKVVARLDHLFAEKEALECMLRLSYEDFIIRELRSLAVNSKSGKVRIRALELLGKTVGLFSKHKSVC